MPPKNWPTCPDCDEWAFSGECENPVCPSKRERELEADSGNPRMGTVVAR
jgi:hypothetical protein